MIMSLFNSRRKGTESPDILQRSLTTRSSDQTSSDRGFDWPPILFNVLMVLIGLVTLIFTALLYWRGTRVLWTSKNSVEDQTDLEDQDTGAAISMHEPLAVLTPLPDQSDETTAAEVLNGEALGVGGEEALRIERHIDASS